MKTKKQRDHQRERRNRKRAERWERDVATPQFVTAMLLADNRVEQLYMEHAFMKRASLVIRYRHRSSITLALKYEINRRTRKDVIFPALDELKRVIETTVELMG